MTGELPLDEELGVAQVRREWSFSLWLLALESLELWLLRLLPCTKPLY